MTTCSGQVTSPCVLSQVLTASNITPFVSALGWRIHIQSRQAPQRWLSRGLEGLRLQLLRVQRRGPHPNG